MLNRDFLYLVGFMAICLAVGGTAGYFTVGGVREWFPTLVKPSFNPPNWIFAPVWTALYIMMGVAAWLVWRQGGDIALALWLFFIQLAFNFLWSFLFFNLHRPDLALVDIGLLWISIAATLYTFWQVDIRAGLLLVPYLAWVSFASLLNASIWRLN